MKIKHRKPDIYNKCHEVFGVNWDDGIILTYGDSVYCKYEITPDLEAHEATHIRQQAQYGKDEWWDRYFLDASFRLSQEVEAYKNQIQFCKENYSRQQRRVIERKIYKDMATIYGDMCTEEEAKKILKNE